MSKGNFGNRALVINQRQNNLKKSSQSGRWLARQTCTSLLALGLGAGFWFTNVAIAPQIAQAETSRLDVSLNRQPNEDYEDLLKRAEAAARAAAQKNFAEQKQVDDLAITIVGHHQGEVAPLLTLGVSRSQWQSNPDVKNWSTYYPNARSLLRFDQDLAESNSNQPNTNNTATSSQNRPSNSTTPRGRQNPSGRTPTPRGAQNPSSPPGLTTSPIQTPTSTGAPTGNNSLNQPGANNSSAPVGGQPTNNTSGQSGTAPSELGAGSGSASGSGIDSPESLTPTPITPADDLSGSGSSNVVRPVEPTSGSTSGGAAGSLNPSDNTLNPTAPAGNTISGGTPNNLIPGDNTLNPTAPTAGAGVSPFSNLAPEDNVTNPTTPNSNSGSGTLDSNLTPSENPSSTPQVIPSGIRNTTNNLEQPSN